MKHEINYDDVRSDLKIHCLALSGSAFKSDILSHTAPLVMSVGEIRRIFML